MECHHKKTDQVGVYVRKALVCSERNEHYEVDLNNADARDTARRQFEKESLDKWEREDKTKRNEGQNLFGDLDIYSVTGSRTEE